MAKGADDNKTNDGADGNTPPADDKYNKPDEGKQADDKKPEEKTGDKKPEEKTYSEADLERAKREAVKEHEKKAKDAENRAKLSEEEKLKADLEAERKENRILKAESVMLNALKDAGANAPELLFKSIKSDLEFNSDGKLKNADDLVADLKKSYPNQFGIEKPTESIDGGKGSGEEPKGKPENLNEALKAYYKK